MNMIIIYKLFFEKQQEIKLHNLKVTPEKDCWSCYANSLFVDLKIRNDSLNCFSTEIKFSPVDINRDSNKKIFHLKVFKYFIHLKQSLQKVESDAHVQS